MTILLSDCFLICIDLSILIQEHAYNFFLDLYNLPDSLVSKPPSKQSQGILSAGYAYQTEINDHFTLKYKYHTTKKILF